MWMHTPRLLFGQWNYVNFTCSAEGYVLQTILSYVNLTYTGYSESLHPIRVGIM